MKLIKFLIVSSLILFGIFLISDRIYIPIYIRNIIDKFYFVAIEMISKVKPVISKYDLTISRFVTFGVIIAGCLFVLFHILEKIYNAFFRFSHQEATTLKTKHSIKKVFNSLVNIKIGFILFKILLLVTQAWSVSKFVKYFISEPLSFINVIQGDVIFFVILGILLVLFLFKKKTDTSKGIKFANN